MQIGGRKFRIKTIIKVILAIAGASAGITAAGLFAKTYHNKNAAVWAGVSAGFAIFFLYIVFSVHRDVQRKIPLIRFVFYMFVGAVGAVTGLVVFIVYLVIAATNKESVKPEGHYVVVVWGFMTFKWALFSLLWARSYYKIYKSPEDQTMIVNS